MLVETSEDARRFVERHGGRLFVWAGVACCGGTRFVETSVDVPRDADRFVRVPTGAFERFVKPATGRLPDSLSIEVRGRRRPRARGFWNGCGFIV
jgi:hypothetical protein